MPVAVNFGDDVTLHKDAEAWRYVKVEPNESLTVIELLDGDGHSVSTDLIAQNVCQITTITDEEFDEANEMMR